MSFRGLLLVGLLLVVSLSHAQDPELVVPDTVIGLGTLNAVAPSPDGTALLTAGSSGITLWDTDTWQRRRFPLSESANTRYLDWDINGRYFVSFNNHVRLWDAASQELIKSGEPENFVDAVALSPGGNFIATAQGWSEKWVIIYDWRSDIPPVIAESKGLFSFFQRKPVSLPLGAVHSYALSGNSALYLTFTSDTGVLSVSTEGVIQEATFNPNAEKVSLRTSVNRKLPASGRLRDVAFNADYTRVAAVVDDTLSVWSYPELRELASYTREGLESVAFSRSGKSLLAVDSSGNGVRWQYESGQISRFGERDPTFHAGYDVTSLGAEEKVLVHGYISHTLDLYDADTLAEISTPFGAFSNQLFSFSLAPDEESVTIKAYPKLKKRYRLSDGVLVETIEIPRGGCGGFGSYHYTSDARFEGVEPKDAKGRLVLYKSDTCKSVATLEGVENPVSTLAVSLDGRYALLTSIHGVAEVWDLESETKLFSPTQQVYSPYQGEEVPMRASGGAFSPDETLVAVHYSDRLVVFDLRTHEQVDEVSLSGVSKGSFSAVSFASDSAHLAGGDTLGNLFVWNYPFGSAQYELVGHTNSLRAVTFLSDGERLVTASSDGTVRLWTLP